MTLYSSYFVVRRFALFLKQNHSTFVFKTDQEETFYLMTRFISETF